LPAGGKGFEQKIFPIDMQILRNPHLQLACLVYDSHGANFQTYIRKDRMEIALVFLCTATLVFGAAGIAKAISIRFKDLESPTGTEPVPVFMLGLDLSWLVGLRKQALLLQDIFRRIEINHFLMTFLCVFVGMLTGLLLSETVVTTFLPSTQTLLPKNGMVLLTYP
jgi:hypothetical protein